MRYRLVADEIEKDIRQDTVSEGTQSILDTASAAGRAYVENFDIG